MSTKDHTSVTPASKNPWETHKEAPIHYLSLSSGGLGGLALVGGWLALERLGLTSGIRGFAGSSMGAIIALLSCLGYTGKEQRLIAHHLNYKHFSAIEILGLLDNMGLETGNQIMEFLAVLLERKVSSNSPSLNSSSNSNSNSNILGGKQITFQQLWNVTGRKLFIAASCVEEHCCHYFSVDTHPEMSVLLAVRMSIAIPWLFTAIKWQGKTYVDAGIYDPCPVHMFAPRETLVFRLNNCTPDRQLLQSDGGMLGFIEHSANILYGVYRRLNQRHYEDLEKEYRCLTIETGANPISLSMSKKDRHRMVAIGYRTTVETLIKIKGVP